MTFGPVAPDSGFSSTGGGGGMSSSFGLVGSGACATADTDGAGGGRGRFLGAASRVENRDDPDEEKPGKDAVF